MVKSLILWKGGRRRIANSCYLAVTGKESANVSGSSNSFPALGGAACKELVWLIIMLLLDIKNQVFRDSC